PERRDAGRGAVRSGRRLAVPLRRRRDPAPGHGTDPAHESAQDPRVPGLGDSGGLHGRGQRGGRRRARAHGGQPSRLPAPARAGAVHGAAAGGALPRARREEQLAQPPGPGCGRTPARGARVMAGAAEIQAVLASGLFDFDWYRQRWPAAAADPEAAVAHFLDRGVSLGLDPGPAFSARRYLRENPDVAAAGMNPLLHYLAYGRGEGRAAFRVDDAGDDDPLPMPQPPSPQTLERWAREVALLRDSALFDPDFYLDRYPDVRAAGVDPLQHFVEHGAREGRWPNPWFDPAWYRANHQRGDDDANPLLHYAHAPGRATSRTSEWFDGGYYRKRHPDAAASDATPLEHFLRHGVDQGHATREESRAALPARIPDLRGIAATVVVTVHNAASHLEACLGSVLRHTRLDAGDSLLVVDDASDEPAVAKVLERLDGMAGVRVVRNDRNLGYTASANLGCRLAAGTDVVLLSSDTVVGPHWLRNLKIAAYRRTRIGTVTAVSDNAGAFSVPREGANALPDGVSIEELARAVADAGAADFEVPTGNGFCLYLRRAMLDEVGGFDEQAFALGYGEENDLCMRALAAGWHHLVEPRVFVHHARSASFGERREALAHAGAERLQALQPGYEAAIAGLPDLRGLVMARYRIGRALRALASGSRPPRQRILYVLSTDNGGIPQTNADLMRALAEDFDCLVLRSDSRAVELWALGDDGYRTVERHPLAEPIGFGTHVGEEYEAVVRDVLLRHSIDLLHIRHIAWHSLNLAGIARGMGVPVVQSIHDFYQVCPSVHLVGREGRMHPGGVAEGGENALWPLDPAAAVPMTRPRLEAWQARMEAALLAADALVTTSPGARDLLLAALPGLAGEGAPPFHVIPHGRDFDRFEALAESGPIREDEPLRVLVPGNIGRHKGGDLVAEVAAMAPPGTIEFHLLGTAPASLKAHVVDHGPY